MPLSWNEIKDRSLRLSREWADEASEDAEGRSFWDGFFGVFGVSRRRVANFERKVALEAECSGWISSTKSLAGTVHRAGADRSPLDRSRQSVRCDETGQ